jgi:CO/xanthine dehydrogenase Mo-binding subunit
VNLNLIGKPMPPLAEVAMNRYLGKADYATRVLLPNTLHVKFLTSPHPRALIKSLDVSAAEKMPGVAHILTYMNAPTTSPLPRNLNFQGEVVAIVAAESEDLAEDAIDAIKVEYDLLPFASSLAQVMAPTAPDLRNGRGNLVKLNENNFFYSKDATWEAKKGDLDKGFAEADIVKEFEYYFAAAMPFPIQPLSIVAKWDGDRVTCWGHGQGIYPKRAALAKGLGVDPSKVRYINRYNGCSFGPGQTSSRFDPHIAHISKVTGRPVRMMLPKDQELGFLTLKPENVTKFKIGVKKDGTITALVHEVYLAAGDIDGTWGGNNSSDHTELYTYTVPNWKSTWYNYRTNSIKLGCVRSCGQQEAKWAWESLFDEMAEILGKDPVEYRKQVMPRPGPADLGALANEKEAIYDSFSSMEVVTEGAKAFGWDKRNLKPGSTPGRYKRGVGVALSMHHNGHMGYHDQEALFEKQMVTGATKNFTFSTNDIWGAEIEIDAKGDLVMKSALPDSGTNHDTALATVISEMLGFTTRDHVHVLWGDSDLAPASGAWYAGNTITMQGAAVCSAADKMRKDLLRRASETLKVEREKLQIKDGVISAVDDPKKRTTFASLVAANKGPIRAQGRGGLGERVGKYRNRGIGAAFVEVEVDTWTGDWKFIRSVYSHDVGHIVNPLVGEADMHGSMVESFQITTEPLPIDREFPGARHYAVGFLSYRLPTIMDVPEQQTQVFIDSLEPRWFYGIKSFSETSIGAVPGALANAIYNATGLRLRDHPITRDKIIAGLKAMQRKS